MWGLRTPREDSEVVDFEEMDNGCTEKGEE